VVERRPVPFSARIWLTGLVIALGSQLDRDIRAEQPEGGAMAKRTFGQAMEARKPIAFVLTHPALFDRLEIDAYEREVLSNPRATEHDASRFFANYPKFLFLGRGSRVRREVVFLDAASGRRSRVDFFRQNYGDVYWDIIELKSPTVESVTRAYGDHPRPSSAVYDALNQAEDYRSALDRDRQARAALSLRGIKVLRPQILLIVGRTPNAIDPDAMRELFDRCRRGPTEFLTYDDLYRFAIDHYADSGFVVVPATIEVPASAVRVDSLLSAMGENVSLGSVAVAWGGNTPPPGGFDKAFAYFEPGKPPIGLGGGAPDGDGRLIIANGADARWKNDDRYEIFRVALFKPSQIETATAVTTVSFYRSKSNRLYILTYDPQSKRTYCLEGDAQVAMSRIPVPIGDAKRNLDLSMSIV
jgi:hypothetical protein